MKRVGNFENLLENNNPVGGGGGVSFANHYNGTVSPTDASTADTWTNAGIINMVGSFAGGREFWLELDAILGGYSGVGGNFAIGVRITDYSGNPVAGTTKHFISNFVATIPQSNPVKLKGRYTFAGTVGNPFFRVQIRTSSANCTASLGYTEWTGALSGDEDDPEFYAHENLF